MADRFTIDEPQKGLYIVEDTITGILCMFEQGKFNDSQKFDNVPTDNPMILPTLMRELGDWLVANHYEKLF